MERPSKFAQSLLVLLMIIEVIFACECQSITLGQAMCQSRTVIRARVFSDGFFDEEWCPNSDENEAVFIRYKLNVIEVFQEGGPQKLSLNNADSYMIFPRQSDTCGGVLLEDVDYVIAGKVEEVDKLYSSTCHHIAQYEDIVVDSHKMDILRRINVDCVHV